MEITATVGSLKEKITAEMQLRANNGNQNQILINSVLDYLNSPTYTYLKYNRNNILFDKLFGTFFGEGKNIIANVWACQDVWIEDSFVCRSQSNKFFEISVLQGWCHATVFLQKK